MPLIFRSPVITHIVYSTKPKQNKTQYTDRQSATVAMSKISTIKSSSVNALMCQFLSNLPLFQSDEPILKFVLSPANADWVRDTIYNALKKSVKNPNFITPGVEDSVNAIRANEKIGPKVFRIITRALLTSSKLCEEVVNNLESLFELPLGLLSEKETLKYKNYLTDGSNNFLEKVNFCERLELNLKGQSISKAKFLNLCRGLSMQDEKLCRDKLQAMGLDMIDLGSDEELESNVELTSDVEVTSELPTVLETEPLPEPSAADRVFRRNLFEKKDEFYKRLMTCSSLNINLSGDPISEATFLEFTTTLSKEETATARTTLKELGLKIS